jgi:hypothetical protein
MTKGTGSRKTAILCTRLLAPLVAVAMMSGSAFAQVGGGYVFFPGNLVVSRSVYDNNPNNVTVGETLPPNCTTGCGTAVTDGSYPQVFNNDGPDGSFGVTSRIFLDQIIPPLGLRLSSLEVPNSSERGLRPGSDVLVTSFSSKSELALNLSPDRKSLTFMGYVAPIDTLDVSNSNTPGAVDPTNPVPATIFRAVAQIDRWGSMHFTETNAYSGNNGRAALYNPAINAFYTAGNAGNGSGKQPVDVILGAGAQFVTPSEVAESLQTPGLPTPLSSFSVTELGDSADKIGKDDNFRGLTIYNNVVYYSKGSGGNGVNTVYFVDTTGKACPNGVGLPIAGAALPTAPESIPAATLTNLQKDGLPNDMCILAGFPQVPNSALATVTNFPFGLWFANATTLYVADEGDGTIANAGKTVAGLQKWTFNASKNEWQLAYVLTNGLQLGVPYNVPGYPRGLNSGPGGTDLAWAPETDGLRNLTGIVNRDGTATLYAVTSTVSGSGDQGADPNKVVCITDQLAATTAPAWERFWTVESAAAGEVLRGVAWAPDAGNPF